MIMSVTERFLNYVSFDTRSDELSSSCPSTYGQRIFAQHLAAQLHDIGMQDVSLDDNGYLMATLPANNLQIPTIGFIAHLDTSPDMTGTNVQPHIILYNGGDVILNSKDNIVLSPDVFPELNNYIGQKIIVTDGTTLLGADDKAGIAAIISAMEYLISHPDIQHGKVRIAFTPDEEIGRGADHFDVEKFCCRWAYTVDGGALGSLEYENFNAATAHITFKGCSVHPGYAKNKMRNAADNAVFFHTLLPLSERPQTTDGYNGFFHLTSMNGYVEEAHLHYLIRDHDRQRFNLRKQLIRDHAAKIPDTTVDIRDQYYNMREKIEPCMQIVLLAEKAMIECGVTPVVEPVRGGTDGSRLSFMGLPCPNIFTGGHNFHGRYEFLPINSLEKCQHTIVSIINTTALL
jgi:tripeptide aminopeptidase